MPETTATPDEVFDADLYSRAGLGGIADRCDWLIHDGAPVHDPIVETRWECPACHESGVLKNILGWPHGDQHADGIFDLIVSLTINDVRASEV